MDWFLSLGWFIRFWIITSIASILILWITAFSIDAEMKREFDFIKKSKVTFIEAIRASLICFVPFMNVIILLYCIFGYNSAYELTVEDAKNKGRIIEKK